MEQKDINNQQLRNFVEYHNLRDNYGIIQFNSIVNITTVKNKIDRQKMRVSISFDDFDSYGRITLLESNLNPYLFPTVFEGKWQTMKHIDDVYLEITDVHTKNADIGKYKIKIVPLDKLRDNS